MEFLLCTCGVKAPHGRFFYDNGSFSRPFFSLEGVIRVFAINAVSKLPTIFLPMGRIPEDNRAVMKAVVANLSRLPVALQQEYLEITRLASSLPITEQLAWDALPENYKKTIRTFKQRGEQYVSPTFWPGGHATKYELACRLGTNPPSNPEAPCNIITMLYAPLDMGGDITLER